MSSNTKKHRPKF